MQQDDLYLELGAGLKSKIELTITDNLRSLISAKRHKGLWRIRLHHMFLSADPGTVKDLVTFFKTRQKGSLNRFIESSREKIRAPADRQRSIQMVQVGNCYDLRRIYEEINSTYFDGNVDARITWGARRVKQRQRYLRFGSYSIHSKIIRIHRVLDQEWVPLYFVEYIVYHEMLHQVSARTARSIHTAAYNKAERLYRHYEKAKKWQQANINRLLRP